LMCHC